MWCLDLKTYAWDKVKRQGMGPGPRAGFNMAVHKRRALLFGGVADQETRGGEDIVSEFFNELFTFAADTQRWFPVAFRPPKAKKEGELDSVERQLAKAQLDKAPETAESKAATKIQAHFRG